MNPYDTIKNTYDLFRQLTADDVRDYADARRGDAQRYARSRADSFLSDYGYHRAPSTTAQILGHFASFGLGMAVGTGLGMLIAPKAGAETREELSSKATDTYGKVSEYLSQALSSSSSEASDASTSSKSSSSKSSAKANGSNGSSRKSSAKKSSSSASTSS